MYSMLQSVVKSDYETNPLHVIQSELHTHLFPLRCVLDCFDLPLIGGRRYRL